MHIVWTIVLNALLIIGIQGCSDKSTSDTGTPASATSLPDTAVPSTVVHHGQTYGTVRSPLTGRIWLDRNLGARRVCRGFDDPECFGDYYQWGRMTDGHQDNESDVNGSLAQDVTVVGHSDFITVVDPQAFGDWAFGWDSNGSIRSAQWRKTDGTSVCPTGFRVPTLAELRAELFDAGSAGIKNRADAFNTFLKLPSAGVRDYMSGDWEEEGTRGELWSASVLDASYAAGVSFDASGEETESYIDGRRASGFSVRCIMK